MYTHPRPTNSKIYILVESQNDARALKFEMHHELREDSMVPIIIFPFPSTIFLLLLKLSPGSILHLPNYWNYSHSLSIRLNVTFCMKLSTSFINLRKAIFILISLSSFHVLHWWTCFLHQTVSFLREGIISG